MKTLFRSFALLPLMLSGACSEAECLMGEYRVGDRCVRLSGSPRDAATTDSDVEADEEANAPVGSRFDGGAPVADPSASVDANVVSNVTDDAAASSQIETEKCPGQLANTCGGCGALDHVVSEACSNGGTGSCALPGTYQCLGDRLVCNAPPPSPGVEVCDGVDNDCDGQVDETLLNACGSCGPVPAETCDGKDNDCNGKTDDGVLSTWYQDCDGDGYAASGDGSMQSCNKPPNAAACSWTSTAPSKDTHSNWDCNDSSTVYRPGADFGLPPAGFSDPDLDCSGVATPGKFANTIIRVCDARDFADIWQGACTYAHQGVTGACAFWRDKSGTATPTPKECPDKLFNRRVAVDDITGQLTCMETSIVAQTWTCK